MNELATTNNRDLVLRSFNDDLYSRYIAFIDAKPKTIETYTRALRQFFKYRQQYGITNPTREDVIAYREHLKETCKPSTVQNYIIALRQFFKWAENEGLYKNVAQNVKGQEISKEHKKDYLTGKQVKIVMSEIQQSDSITAKRDYAIFSLMITGGLRTIEVVRANVEDMRPLGESTVLYLQGKGKDERASFVKLPEQVEKAIRDYLRCRGQLKGNQPLFASTSNNNHNGRVTTRTISGIVKEHLRAAGFDSDRLTAHSLRHTAANLNLRNGGTLEETQQLLRHTNITTTMIYIKSIEREDNPSESRIANLIF